VGVGMPDVRGDQALAEEALPRRLSRIYDELGALIVEHRPDEVAIEGIFYALNVKSALKLGRCVELRCWPRPRPGWRWRSIRR